MLFCVAKFVWRWFGSGFPLLNFVSKCVVLPGCVCVCCLFVSGEQKNIIPFQNHVVQCAFVLCCYFVFLILPDSIALPVWQSETGGARLAERVWRAGLAERDWQSETCGARLSERDWRMTAPDALDVLSM